MTRILTCAAIATALSILPTKAQAQTFLTPFAGTTTGGDASGKLVYGANLMWVDTVGLEIDFGYSPDFFDDSDDLQLVSDSNVTSLTGSFVIAPGEGPVRPYGQIGVGLLRSRAESVSDFFGDVDTSQFGMTAGVGVIVIVNDVVGVKGDLRYLRSFEDEEPADGDLDLGLGTFDFWRVSAGVTFRFGG